MLELPGPGHPPQPRSETDYSSHASPRRALPLPLAPVIPKYTYLGDDDNVTPPSNWSPPLPPEQARPIAVDINANMPPKRPSDVAESPTDSAGNPKLKLPRLSPSPSLLLLDQPHTKTAELVCSKHHRHHVDAAKRQRQRQTSDGL